MSYKILGFLVGDTAHLTADTFLQIRKRLRLSQSELASLLEMSRFTVSRIERGIYPISRRLDFAMAYLMDCNSKLGLSLNSPRTESTSLPVRVQEEPKPATPIAPIKPMNKHKIKKNKNKKRR